jgi:starch phosphorylase
VMPGTAVMPGTDGPAAADVLDPAVLTLAFARRFTGYKRPALLLRDPERLRRLLLDPRRPVQLVMAGKAHPGDTDGKRLVQTVVRFAADPALQHRAVFLEDDDLDVTAHLVAGADVWLNYPLRPLEACGTSGMKVLANGGLNCSIRDGWWAEAYTPEVGWSFGDQDPPDDARDADELYRRLEEDIVPSFYAGDGSWMARVRASMALAPHFDTGRALRDYVEHHYLPAAQRQQRLLGGDGRGARELATWAASLRRHWSEVVFRARMEEGRRLEAVVHLGHVPREGVRVEAYAEDPPSVLSMETSPAPWPDCWRAVATIPEGRQADEYTLRVVPYHPDAPWPATLPLIAWER